MSQQNTKELIEYIKTNFRKVSKLSENSYGIGFYGGIDTELNSEYIHEEIIKKGFLNVNSHSSTPQDMQLQEFVSDVLSENVLIFYASKNDRVVAVMTVFLDIDDVKWIDDTSKKQLELIANNKLILYIGTIVADISLKGIMHVGSDLISEALRILSTDTNISKNAVVCFDCTEYNTRFLPGLIDQKINSLNSQNTDQLELQAINLISNGTEIVNISEAKPYMDKYFYIIRSSKY